MSNEELVAAIQNGINPADNLELLYRQNIGLIHKIVQKYEFVYRVSNSKKETPIIEHQELMNEAYFGLVEAVRRYEDTAGVLFMTYAAFWIRQVITNYLKNNERTIRISAFLYEKVGRYKKILSTFEMTKGREPSDKEICYCMGISQSSLDTIKQACQTYDIQSLDATISGSDNIDLTVGDTVQDKSVNVEDDVVDSIIVNSRKTELWQIVQDTVNPHENEIIKLRYRGNMTLTAAGHKCNISRQRVRQIEATALRKLRGAKVRRLLSEKFEENYARAYMGSIGDFHNRSDSSVVEDIAIRSVEMEGAANS